MLIAIGGANGVGKRTVAGELASLLSECGHRVQLASEPSNGLIGAFAREAEASITGSPLAFLVAADRCPHLEAMYRLARTTAARRRATRNR